MKNTRLTLGRYVTAWIAAFALCAIPLSGRERFQIEMFGGVSFLDPGDLNLLSRAEEQYNQLILVERYLGWEGYFINDFPRISNLIPGGLRLKYRLSDKLAFSVEAEGFRKTREETISGSFVYAPSWSLTEGKEYAPFRIHLEGMSVMGGIHYSFRVGRSTGLEIGAAAGWTGARFDYRSTWSYSIELLTPDYTHVSEDGGTLEGDGKGNGFSARGMFRLNRDLGRNFGFFVETSACYCRIKSIKGSGRETRLGIPGETAWEGSWGIKREEIEIPSGAASILVPTNYWEGWVAGQWERDFVLDLSGLRLCLGIYLRF